MKIRPVWAECYQKDGHDVDNSRFSQFLQMRLKLVSDFTRRKIII